MDTPTKFVFGLILFLLVVFAIPVIRNRIQERKRKKYTENRMYAERADVYNTQMSRDKEEIKRRIDNGEALTQQQIMQGMMWGLIGSNAAQASNNPEVTFTDCRVENTVAPEANTSYNAPQDTSSSCTFDSGGSTTGQ